MMLRGEAPSSRPAGPDGSQRLGSDGVFSPEPARALATRSGGFDDTDSESESDFEDVCSVCSSDDEDDSRGRHGDEAETGGTSVEGRASRDSARATEESFSARVAEALREMRFQRNAVATDAARGAFSFPAGKTPPAAGESRRHFRRVRTARATPSALFMSRPSSGRRRADA
jgi:hypothetical protein